MRTYLDFEKPVADLQTAFRDPAANDRRKLDVVGRAVFPESLFRLSRYLQGPSSIAVSSLDNASGRYGKNAPRFPRVIRIFVQRKHSNIILMCYSYITMLAEARGSRRAGAGCMSVRAG